MPTPLTVIVMGTCGSGKSTVGELLAGRLGLPFAEADGLHPAANVAKMSRGVPLDDGDRVPWLAAIADRISAARPGGGVVVACSALKRSYRDRLREADPNAYFAHLAVDRDLVVSRMAGRAGHFMPVSLIDSQFQTLEPLGSDESGVVLDATGTPEQIAADVLVALGR